MLTHQLSFLAYVKPCHLVYLKRIKVVPRSNWGTATRSGIIIFTYEYVLSITAPTVYEAFKLLDTADCMYYFILVPSISY